MNAHVIIYEPKAGEGQVTIVVPAKVDWTDLCEVIAQRIFPGFNPRPVDPAWAAMQARNAKRD